MSAVGPPPACCTEEKRERRTRNSQVSRTRHTLGVSSTPQRSWSRLPRDQRQAQMQEVRLCLKRSRIHSRASNRWSLLAFHKRLHALNIEERACVEVDHTLTCLMHVLRGRAKDNTASFERGQ
jgi:hypothetical protein